MRELVDKQLMLEDVKSWVAMDSYEQHLINDMSEWIENLPTVEVSDGDCISRRAALDAMKKITFPHWFECGEYLSEDTREIEIINSKKALEVIEALPPAQPDLSEYSDKLWQKAYERGKAEAQAEIVQCKDCRFNTYSKKCLNPDSFFLVPADDFYCGYAERRTDE